MASRTIPLPQGLSGYLVRTFEAFTQDALHTVLIPVLIAGTSLAIGYFLGTSATRLPTTPVLEGDNKDDSVEEASDGDLSALAPGFMEPCKMVRPFFQAKALCQQNITGVGCTD